MEDPLDDAVETVSDVAAPVVEEAAETAQPVVEEAAEAAQPVQEIVAPAVEETVEAAKPVVEEIVDTVGPIAEPVKETVDPVVEEVDEATKPLVDLVVDELEETTEPLLDATEPLVDATEPLLELGEDVAEQFQLKRTIWTGDIRILDGVGHSGTRPDVKPAQRLSRFVQPNHGSPPAKEGSPAAFMPDLTIRPESDRPASEHTSLTQAASALPARQGGPAMPFGISPSAPSAPGSQGGAQYAAVLAAAVYLLAGGARRLRSPPVFHTLEGNHSLLERPG